MVDLVSLCRLHMRPCSCTFNSSRLQRPAHDHTDQQVGRSHATPTVVEHTGALEPGSTLNLEPPMTSEQPTPRSRDGAPTGAIEQPGERGQYRNSTYTSTSSKCWQAAGSGTFHTQVRNTRVTIFSDNTTVVAYINRQGGTRSDKLCRLAWEVLTTATDSGMVLRASHIAGKDNVMADALSRGQLDPNEWTLSQQTCDRIFLRFGRPLIDLFARGTTTGCPPFAPGDSTHRPFNRRHVPVMGRTGRLSISTSLHDQPGAEEDKVLQGEIHPGGPLLATQTLVRGDPPTPRGHTSNPSRHAHLLSETGNASPQISRGYD
ncbi:putative E3 ubiquitin-protein ligase HERC1-like [Apostichopus japonicus]|uniref:Putative E3 ubiquitin-protein ligase HERC1-like n=1 Tax=Stichopus japonicus TaxID=307972 RepID=A0A2G8LBM1_STIJA|nr:putative E3 ubiquitin-protein ligase HERC1-like [Apostichopus japonicus]